MADTDFLSIVLEWRIEDIFDGEKFHQHLAPIPKRFNSRKDYYEAFKWPLIDDTRADLQQSLENIGSSAYVSVWASVRSKASSYDSSLRTLELITKGGKECVKRNKRDAPWLPKGTDLAVLTTIVPNRVEDLQSHGEIYFLVEICYADEDYMAPLVVVAQDGGETWEDSISLDPKRFWYLVFLDTVATRMRTWDALTPNPEKACPEVAGEILDSGRLKLEVLMRLGQLKE